jgi:hypothetical protein
MLKSDLIEKIDRACAAFEDVIPSVRNQTAIDLTKDNLHSILFSLTIPTVFKDVCREQIKLINEFSGPLQLEKKDMEKFRLLIMQNFERLKKIASRYDFPSANELK